MSDGGEVCEYVLDPGDPETWGSERTRYPVMSILDALDEEFLNENGVWTCPHPTEEGESLCPFHRPVEEKDDEAVVDAFSRAISSGDDTGDCDRRGQFLGVRFGRFDLGKFPSVDTGKRAIVIAHANVSGEFDCSGVEFDENIAFFDVAFERDARFQNTEFGGDVGFFDVDFEKDADFQNATFGAKSEFGVRFSDEQSEWLLNVEFRGETTFRNAEFAGDVTFENADIRGEINFNEAEFADEATFLHSEFKDEARFVQTEFSADANFNRSNFNDFVSFTDATFRDDARFWATQFGGNVFFHRAEFNNDAEFGKTEFNDVAAFPNTAFERVAYFGGVDFHDSAHFSQTEFEGEIVFSEADLSDAEFKECDVRCGDFRDANLENSDLEGADFSTANLEKAKLSNADLFGTDLSGARLYGARIGDAAIDTETVFDERGEHRCVYDPHSEYEYDSEGENVGQLRKAMGAYHVLEQLTRANTLPDDQAAFFTRRQDMRRAQLRQDESFPRFNYWFAAAQNAIFRHGEGFSRVVAWSIGVIVTFAFVYPLGGWLESESTGAITYGSIIETPSLLWKSFYHSALLFLTGELALTPTGPFGEVLMTIESMMAPVLLALLVFVLGRRAAR